MKTTVADGSDRKLRIGFVLARSFTLSAFALFVDTIRLASDELDRSGRILADWRVLGSTRHLIASSCGVQIAPTSDFTDPGQFDYIVVVGGLLTVEEPIDAETIAFLRRADARGVPLIGVCTGTFVLAAAGLMGRHQACVSWLHHEAYRERFPDLPVCSDRLFSLERSRGSCAGGSSAADLAAFIVRRHISRQAERNALEVLQIDKARSSRDVQPRRPLDIGCDDDRLKMILIAMEQNLEGAIAIPDFAASAGLSRRQMERLFQAKLKKSPARIYKEVRMDRARKLLIHTKAPIIDIALEVGFESSSHFCKVFKGLYGDTPNGLRARHSKGT